MSDNRLTHENVRAAAEVVASYVLATDPIEHKNTHRVLVSANMLLDYADRLEREQASKVKRAKRIEELAQMAYAAFSPEWECMWESSATRQNWRNVARAFLDAFPSLLDEPKGQK